MSKQTMTIGDLSRITGLSTSAIRFYQRRGLLPGRDAAGGWQRYDDEALDRLAVIELAKSGDFHLDEVTRLLDAMDTDPDTVPDAIPIWRGLAESKLVEIEAKVHRLQQLSQLLRDTLECSYLSPDRARQVPAALGWTAGNSEADPLPQPLQIPASTADLERLDAGGQWVAG